MDIDKEVFFGKPDQTFFFYDLETSGLSPKTDRIMQFAGIRTDLDFNQIGEPINLLVKLSDDTLPSPQAIQVTKITPQSTLADGLTEPEFCKYIEKEIFTPGTIAVGYNSIRFDDEFMRYTFYRNFYDPYEWQWKDGCSRWDLLDVVRMTRALRPEGINWPVSEVAKRTEDGTEEKFLKPNNRLENLTKVNNISHEHAHDALSDVEALISVTKLIAEKQPNLYDFLLKTRDKKNVTNIVLQNSNNFIGKPFVYSTGKYSSKNMHTSVAVVIGPALDNTRNLVFDLRYNLDELLELEKNFKPEEKTLSNGKKIRTNFHWEPIVKELAFNRCPAVAPLGVLDPESNEDSTDEANPSKKGSTGWDKIGLTKDQVKKNYESLKSHPEFINRMYELFSKKKDSYEKFEDVDGQLYEGFASDSDKLKIADVRHRNANELADYNPIFSDERYSELLLHYKGRNFPKSLSEDEQKSWEAYRIKRLQSQEKSFVEEIEKLQLLATSGKPMSNGKLVDENILEDLLLWYQSLADGDY